MNQVSQVTPLPPAFTLGFSLLLSGNPSKGQSDHSQGAGVVSSRGSSGRGSSRRFCEPQEPLTLLSRRRSPAARPAPPAQRPPAPPLRPLPRRGRPANRARARREAYLCSGLNAGAIFSDRPGRLGLPRALWLAPLLGVGPNFDLDLCVPAWLCRLRLRTSIAAENRLWLKLSLSLTWITHAHTDTHTSCLLAPAGHVSVFSMFRTWLSGAAPRIWRTQINVC